MSKYTVGQKILFIDWDRMRISVDAVVSILEDADNVFYTLREELYDKKEDELLDNFDDAEEALQKEMAKILAIARKKFKK